MDEPLRCTAVPVLESIALPELSIILVLGAVEEFLPETADLVPEAVLPEIASRELTLEADEDLPDANLLADVLTLLAELVR